MPARSAKSPVHAAVPPTGIPMLVMPTGTQATFVHTAAIERREIEGTVDAAIEPIDAHSYGLAGEPMIVARGCGGAAVLSRTPGRFKTLAAPRAVDLIGELQAISSQVNRMVAQVERVIDRLAVHAG